MNIPFLIFLHSKIKAAADHLGRLLKSGWLSLVLIAIFVIQNHLFNIWLKIPDRPHFLRLSIVAAALGLLFFGPAILLQRRRIKYWYLIIISTLVSVIFVLQFLYYSYSGQSF